MSQYGMSVYEYNRLISIAFQSDVENFLSEFEQKRSFKFKDFSEVWKKLMFSYIFSEQYYFVFVESFMDNAFFVLKKFIMFPKNIYTEVGALYLLYALYFKQTVNQWIKIRVTSEEFKKLEDLVERLKTMNEQEPLFVYHKLKKAKAFEYVFVRLPIAPEFKYIKNCTDFVDDTFQSISARQTQNQLEASLNEGNFLENLRKTTESYRAAISSISAQYPGLASFSSSTTIMDDMNKLLGKTNTPGE